MVIFVKDVGSLEIFLGMKFFMGCGKDCVKVEDMREDSRECYLMFFRIELEEVMKCWVLRIEGLVGGWLDCM